jgi:hypothetical protein
LNIHIFGSSPVKTDYFSKLLDPDSEVVDAGSIHNILSHLYPDAKVTSHAHNGSGSAFISSNILVHADEFQPGDIVVVFWPAFDRYNMEVGPEFKEQIQEIRNLDYIPRDDFKNVVHIDGHIVQHDEPGYWTCGRYFLGETAATYRSKFFSKYFAVEKSIKNMLAVQGVLASLGVHQTHTEFMGMEYMDKFVRRWYKDQSDLPDNRYVRLAGEPVSTELFRKYPELKRLHSLLTNTTTPYIRTLMDLDLPVFLNRQLHWLHQPPRNQWQFVQNQILPRLPAPDVDVSELESKIEFWHRQHLRSFKLLDSE